MGEPVRREGEQRGQGTGVQECKEAAQGLINKLLV
jgi:hypothetical protein